MSNSEKSDSDSENNSKNESDKESKDDNKDSGKRKGSKDNSDKSSAKEVHDSFEESEESLNEDEDYNKLKDELDKANNFIDYFLVVGVDPEIYNNNWLYECDADELNKKYKEQLEPKIISSFPPFEKHTISFDESILMHCFPRGFEIIKYPTQPKPIVFSFILDNNYFNLNYPQKYLTCLMCFENISQYKILYEQHNKLSQDENESNKEKNNFNVNSKNTIAKVLDSLKYPDIYIPKCLLVMSLTPFFGEYERIIIEIYNYSLGIIHRDVKENQLVNDDIRSTFERQRLKRKMGNCRVDISDPIDKIIENLLIELPIPPRGFSTLEYTLNNQKRLINQTKMNQLPIININLKRLFLDYEVRDIILIYNYLFLEGRILFFSEKIEILNLYIYGFLALLYPFQYQYQIVTILPEKNFEIMESITPFIAGINQKYEKDFFDKRDFTLSDSILVIDIDNCTYEVYNEMTKMPEFPKNSKAKLEKELNAIVSKYLRQDIKTKKTQISLDQIIRAPKPSEILRVNTIRSNFSFYDKNNNNIFFSSEMDDSFSNFNIDYNFNTEVNEVFFNFNANLLSNYSKYLNLDFYSSNVMPCLEILFKVNSYLKDIPTADKEFYDKFVSETQIFGDFLFLRMIPKNTKEKLRILLFDEKINKNSVKYFSKAPSSVFTDSTEYEFVDKFEIQKPRKFTEYEIKYYKKHKKALLSYGIVVTEEKKTGKLKLFYPVFPKLTTKLFFEKTFHEYYCPNNWSDSIESVNEDLISQSHLGGISMRENDMKNYIYLCWMQMWAMTFWYCDEIEQNYRFQKLLEILNKTSCYEMEIFNLLFETLSKYSKNNNMILKLYAVLLKLHLNPSLKVHKIVMDIIEKKNMEGNFNEKLKKLLEKEGNKRYDKKGFRKRVFRPKYFTNILSEDITFYSFDTCIICQNLINLEDISKDFKSMTREIEWTKCPKCKNPILPKILIQFGKEINKTGQMERNTSIYENVVLFSPYGLKTNYTTTLLKTFGIKLDLDEFIIKFGGIFWDSLWYFKLNNLEYDFMIPYENKYQAKYINILDVEKGKIKNDVKININNNNNNGFDLNDLEIEKYQLTIFPTK